MRTPFSNFGVHVPCALIHEATKGAKLSTGKFDKLSFDF
jgi:hypothetical protein